MTYTQTVNSCFKLIEFQDLQSAMATHTSLQGVTLTSSDRGGIRIQFSKNPFGQKSCLVGGLQTNGKAETSSSLATSRSKLVAENLGASEPS